MGTLTTEVVARWMADQVLTSGALYQDEAVDAILREFGNDFVHENDNGNLAIDRPVLNAFRKLTEDSVVWDREDRMWRPRQPGDVPGRQQ